MYAYKKISTFKNKNTKPIIKNIYKKKRKKKKSKTVFEH